MGTGRGGLGVGKTVKRPREPPARPERRGRRVAPARSPPAHPLWRVPARGSRPTTSTEVSERACARPPGTPHGRGPRLRLFRGLASWRGNRVRARAALTGTAALLRRVSSGLSPPPPPPPPPRRALQLWGPPALALLRRHSVSFRLLPDVQFLFSFCRESVEGVGGV